MNIKEIFSGHPETTTSREAKLKAGFILKAQNIFRKLSPESGNGSIMAKTIEVENVKIERKLRKFLRKINPPETQTIKITYFGSVARNRATLKFQFTTPQSFLSFEHDNPDIFSASFNKEGKYILDGREFKSYGGVEQLELANDSADFVLKLIDSGKIVIENNQEQFISPSSSRT